MSFEQIDLQWFAAEDEGRTEEPSDYKLKKARDEGRIAKSQELCAAVVLLFTVVTLVILAPHIFRTLADVMVFFFTRCTEHDLFQKRFFGIFLMLLAKLVLPIAGVGILAGVISNIAQNRGFLFTTKPIEPQFSKIIPKFGQYLKKTIFSFEGVFNIVKSLVKVFFVGVIAFIIIYSNLPIILQFINAADVLHAVGKIASTAALILVSSAVLFLIISIPDYFVQKKQFIESMKMTKQEVKQEYKEMEGDPEVKSHLEQAQRQLLQRNIPKQVAKSDVVIANPTHFAVALLYDPKLADAPQIMAKGADAIAQRIKAIARENDVPIIENKPLARALYAETEVGDIIPNEYISAIVTIYTQIDYLNKKK